jgi:hypothetical protein
MPENSKDKIRNTSDIGAVGGECTTKPALTIDYALYEKYLEDSDLTDEQKQEFLDTLWSIIVGFVDLGFCVHPLQQAAPNVCGQEIDLSGFMASNVVSSLKSIPTNEFETAVAGSKPSQRESEEI